MSGAFARILRNRWVRTGFGAALLVAIIWVFGPLFGFGPLHPLEGRLARGLAVTVIVAGWAIENLLHALRDRRTDQALVRDVATTGANADAQATAEETALLAQRLREALTTLRRARLGGGRRPLYQLPWYMFIGPPGAGKTTALRNAGLRFPLADTTGAQAVSGVGGTRNCDWWFTDQAVLIDTAGRYTTQDSNAAVDAGAWLGFLRLLKRHRRRQPLNGVLVAIGLADLAALTEAERSAHAQAIRRRIRELAEQLGVRVPVYVLFTKADLIAGFMEFFADLGQDERAQVWGVTLALDDGMTEGGAVAGFAQEFDGLLARIDTRMLHRLQQEPDLARRRLIADFPQQLAALRDVAVAFLNEVFRPSRLEARPLLRGAYLASGTQDGTPIDRLLGGMAVQFGLGRQAVTAFSGSGRSYFLTRLMQDVVFGEAGLVGRDPKVERRQRLLHLGAYAVAAVVLLGLTGAWTASWIGNRALIAGSEAAAQRYATQYAELARRGRQDTDMAAILPALATLRSMPGGYETRTDAAPLALGFGLYQGMKLNEAATAAYAHALDALLLPRLLARLEAEIGAHMNQPETLYETLKVYLILGRQGPLDRALVEQWATADFAADFPGEDAAPTREALVAHVHAMLQYPLPALPLNGPLIAEARSVLTRQPLADYVYHRVMQTALVQSLPEWTVADNAGPAGARVFQLRDGRPLSSGVPGIFTYDGYHTVFLAMLPRVTKDASEDAWVLGRTQATGMVGSVAAINRLRRDVLALYLDDYTRTWDSLLADIGLIPFTSLQQGQEELFLLSAPDSPLRDLLLAIDAQTQLSRPAAADKAAGEAEAKVAKVGKKLGGFASYLARSGMSLEQSEVTSIFAEAFGSDAAGQPVNPAARVDAHFAALHDFVTGTKGHPPPLDGVIAKLQQIYATLNQAATAPNQGAALLGLVGGGGGAAAPLAEAAQGAPKPVADMLATVSASSAQVTASGAGTELSDAWRSKVLPLCQAAFDRYPFIAGSAQDVPLDDFTHLLGPGGLIDQFFDQYLKPLVDTTQTPWRWQAGGNARLNLSDASLAQFQRARDIRDALYPTGGNQILVRFQLLPTALDPGVAQVTIEIGGTRGSYAHGPAEPIPLQWPAPNGLTQVRVTLTPANGGPATVLEENGPWALLRLLDAARVTPGGQPDRFGIRFASPAGNAAFELDASSVRNPFTLGALRAFRCPAKL
jgi:type VI secretion system protein ImpL